MAREKKFKAGGSLRQPKNDSFLWISCPEEPAVSFHDFFFLEVLSIETMSQALPPFFYEGKTATTGSS